MTDLTKGEHMPKEVNSTDMDPRLPRGRVDIVLDPLRRFMHIESASGVVLLGASALALILANSQWAEEFFGFWRLRWALPWDRSPCSTRSITGSMIF
jgi:hypothetical protein